MKINKSSRPACSKVVKNTVSILSAVIIGNVLMAVAAFADNTMTHDGVMMKNGHMIVIKSNVTMPMNEDIKMTNGTRVMKDGTVISSDGKKIALKDGDCVTMDGAMTKANNHMSGMAMMHDGVMMKDGEMMVMKNGKSSMMMHEMTLKDGCKVMKDGTITKANGQKMMMKDGEMMSMDGEMMKGGM